MGGDHRRRSVIDADPPHRVLAFGTWLEPDKAQAMESSLEALRAHGTGFSTTLTTLAGRPIEAEGQVFGGRAILRLKQVDGVKRELAELQIRCQRQFDESNAMRTLIAALPSPIWARDEAGKLVFANAAYARAVDAKDGAEAVERGLELFESRAKNSCAPTRRQRPLAAGFRPSSPAAAGPSTCSPFRPGAAVPQSASTPPKRNPCAPRSNA